MVRVVRPTARLDVVDQLHGSREEGPNSSARREIRTRAIGLIGRTPVTLLRAPAGFGKSTAMRNHRAGTPARRSAWVSFDAVRALEIDRITGMLADAAGALTGDPDVTGRLRSAAPTRGHGLGHRFVDTLAEVLGGLDEPWWLYLDDIHRLPPMAVEELGDLAARLGESVPRSLGTLVASTRSSPPWPIARWQLAGWLTLVGPDELRFDPDDTRVLLEEHHGDHVDDILATTTGWPAAVATVVSMFDASTGPLAEAGQVAEALDAYIHDEVVPELDPTDLTLLTCLLVVGAAPSAVVATVCGEADATARLRRLVRETALVVEHADERFTLHPLLARVLGERLERLGPSEVRSLHGRAADAWAELPESIVGLAATTRHLAAAGDPTAALEHVRRHWERFFDAGRLDLLVEPIESVPSRYWRDDTGLSLLLGWSHMLLGAETRAQEVFHGTGLVEDRASATIWKLVRAQNTWWRIDPDEALALVRVARDELTTTDDESLPDVPGHRTVAAYRILADIAELRALLLTGRLAEADELARHLHELLWDIEPLGMASVLAMHSLVAALRGEAEQAVLWADDALTRAAELDGDQLLAAPAHLARAVVAALGGDHRAAPAHVEVAAAIARHQQAGNLLGMCDLVSALSPGAPSSRRPSGIAQTRLAFVDRIVVARAAVERLRLGDLGGAERTLLGVTPDELTLGHWAEVLLAVRPRREIARLIAEQPPPVSPAGCVVRRLAEATCLPDGTDAGPRFRDAVELADRHGIVGLVLDAPDALVERSEIASLDDRFIRQLLDDRSSRRDGDDRPRFTRRELEVLERTARSETAGEIAGHMYLSVNTVKWHKANVYRKLGVDGATAAIERARELGLLPPEV